MENNKKNFNFLIVIIVAVLLIGGAWFIFSLLTTQEGDQLSTEEAVQEAKIQKIKLLAEENLEYFPLENKAQSILEKIKDNPQYQNLDLEIDTFINTKTNLGNAYPFASAEEDLQN